MDIQVPRGDIDSAVPDNRRTRRCISTKLALVGGGKSRSGMIEIRLSLRDMGGVHRLSFLWVWEEEKEEKGSA